MQPNLFMKTYDIEEDSGEYFAMLTHAFYKGHTCIFHLNQGTPYATLEQAQAACEQHFKTWRRHYG